MSDQTPRKKLNAEAKFAMADVAADAAWAAHAAVVKTVQIALAKMKAADCAWKAADKELDLAQNEEDKKLEWARLADAKAVRAWRAMKKDAKKERTAVHGEVSFEAESVARGEKCPF